LVQLYSCTTSSGIVAERRWQSWRNYHNAYAGRARGTRFLSRNSAVGCVRCSESACTHLFCSYAASLRKVRSRSHSASSVRYHLAMSRRFSGLSGRISRRYWTRGPILLARRDIHGDLHFKSEFRRSWRFPMHDLYLFTRSAAHVSTPGTLLGQVCRCLFVGPSSCCGRQPSRLRLSTHRSREPAPSSACART
jgi:hypothetical protein